jgi:hypothetical protein
MYVTLPEIKEHLIIEHDLDDDYLILLEAAASDAAARWINRKLCEVVEEEGKLPDSIKLLLLQLIGNWYASREPVEKGHSVQDIPYTLKFLADLNRHY